MRLAAGEPWAGMEACLWQWIVLEDWRKCPGPPPPAGASGLTKSRSVVRDLLWDDMQREPGNF
jgi:hypothetical protein